jgi:hypothetical protein
MYNYLNKTVTSEILYVRNGEKILNSENYICAVCIMLMLCLSEHEFVASHGIWDFFF